MFCPHCHCEIKEVKDRCPNCGHVLPSGFLKDMDGWVVPSESGRDGDTVSIIRIGGDVKAPFAGRDFIQQITLASTDAFFVPARQTWPDIYPRRRAELARWLRIGSGAQVTGISFSNQLLLVEPGSILSGPVYARGPLRLARGVRCRGPVMSFSHVELTECEVGGILAPKAQLAGRCIVAGSVICLELICPADQSHHLAVGTVIEGLLFCANDVPLRIADGCRLSSIVAQGSIVLGPRSIVGSIRSYGDVALGGECHVDYLEANNVEAGPRVRLGKVKAQGTVKLSQGAYVRSLLAQGDIALEPGVQVEAQTLITRSGCIMAHWPISLGRRLVGLEHVFWITPDGQLLPFDGQPEAQTGMLATTLLDHELWQLIVEISGTTPRLGRWMEK